MEEVSVMQDYVSGVAPKPVEQGTSTPIPPEPQRREAPEAPASGTRRVSAVQRDESKSKARAQHNVSTEELAEMLRKVNLTFDLFEIAAEYTVEEEPHRITVVIRNTRTGEVIRRIPPADFIENFNDIKAGLGTLINASV
jgi:uncharacterized FlaG/YvyC family protein